MPARPDWHSATDLSYASMRPTRAPRGRAGAHSPAHPAAWAGMEPVMKAWTDKLASLAPPMWLTTAVAAVFAVALMASFVDAVRDNMKRGQELRLAQSHPPVNPTPEFLAALAETSPDRAAQFRLR